MEFRPQKGTTTTAVNWLVVGALILLAAVLIGWLVNWLITPLVLTDASRVREASAEMNQLYSGLESQRASIKSMDTQIAAIPLTYGEDRNAWPQGKDEEYLQLVAQRGNLVTAYNRLCAQYEAKWNDEWYDIPAPDDLPKTCDLIQ
jgi:hypothetical protein